MPRIPDEIVEQVLQATDIVDLVASYGLSLKRSGSDFQCLCPFHNEKTASFHVNPARQSFKCFGCQKGGSALGFVMEYENLPFQDALRKLAARANITIEEAESDPREDRRRRRQTRLKELHNAAARFLHERLLEDPGAKHARAYLKSRGYGSEMAKRWLVGWMPENPIVFLDWARASKFTGRELIEGGIAKLKNEDNSNSGLWVRFRDRLMFPIYNDYGDVIAFSGRQLREDPRSGKYINSPETPIFRKSNVFFGLDKARRAMGKAKFALLCEGQLDVIACHEAGVENTVAAMGTAFTPDHARLLKRYTDKLVICFDSDSAGHNAATKAFVELAGAGLDVRVAAMPPGEDPDSLIKSGGADAFRARLEEAAEFFDYLLRYQAEHEDVNDPGIKSRLVREIGPLLHALKDKTAQEASINFVATRLGLGTTGVRDAVVAASRQRNYERRSNGEEKILAPTAMEPGVRILATLSLQSHEVLDFLCDQTDTLLGAVEGREGVAVLHRILTARPEVPEPAAVNTFLESLETPDRAALLAILDEPLPEDPLHAAERTLGELTYQSLERRQAAITAKLADPNLSAEELAELQEQVKDLQRIRAEAKKP